MVHNMKRFIFIIISIFIFSVSLVETNASTNSSYILMDADSGRVLYEKNKDERFLTASICKILTCMVAIENGNLFESYKVSYSSSIAIGSSIYLEEDDEITLYDLLHGLMLRSGNDAATLISEVVFNSVDTFVNHMNKLAKRIGMGNSTFENPTGLDNENYNYSTAYDMALLMKYSMENEVFFDISSKTVYRSKTKENSYYWINKHKLVQQYNYVISGKTGYTKKCGRTLVSYASINGMNLVAVSFNENDDFGLHKTLFDKAQKEFSYNIVFEKGVYKQELDMLNYYPKLNNDVSILIKKDSEISAKFMLYEKPENICGYLEIYEDNKLIYKCELFPHYPML